MKARTARGKGGDDGGALVGALKKLPTGAASISSSRARADANVRSSPSVHDGSGASRKRQRAEPSVKHQDSLSITRPPPQQPEHQRNGVSSSIISTLFDWSNGNSLDQRKRQNHERGDGRNSRISERRTNGTNADEESRQQHYQSSMKDATKGKNSDQSAAVVRDSLARVQPRADLQGNAGGQNQNGATSRTINRKLGREIIEQNKTIPKQRTRHEDSLSRVRLQDLSELHTEDSTSRDSVLLLSETLNRFDKGQIQQQTNCNVQFNGATGCKSRGDTSATGDLRRKRQELLAVVPRSKQPSSLVNVASRALGGDGKSVSARDRGVLRKQRSQWAPERTIHQDSLLLSSRTAAALMDVADNDEFDNETKQVCQNLMSKFRQQHSNISHQQDVLRVKRNVDSQVVMDTLALVRPLSQRQQVDERVKTSMNPVDSLRRTQAPQRLEGNSKKWPLRGQASQDQAKRNEIDGAIQRGVGNLEIGRQKSKSDLGRSLKGRSDDKDYTHCPQLQKRFAKDQTKATSNHVEVVMDSLAAARPLPSLDTLATLALSNVGALNMPNIHADKSPGKRKRDLEKETTIRSHEDFLACVRPQRSDVGPISVSASLGNVFDNRKRQRIESNHQENSSNLGRKDATPTKKDHAAFTPTMDSIALVLSPPKAAASKRLKYPSPASDKKQSLDKTNGMSPSKRNQQDSLVRFLSRPSNSAAAVVEPFDSAHAINDQVRSTRKSWRRQYDSDDETDDAAHASVAQRRKHGESNVIDTKHSPLKRRSRQQPGPGPAPPQPQPQKQPWTQLTAFGHILEDETNRYLNPGWQYEVETSDEDKLAAREMFRYLQEQQSLHPDASHHPGDDTLLGNNISQAEQRHLHTWVKAVQARIHRENELVLDNIITTWNIQDTEDEMGRLRHACRNQRVENRRLERQVQVLEEQAQQQQQDAEIQQRASDFLRMVDDM